MTGNTRKYLSDLANRKGVRFENAISETQAWASDRIDELKAMPDATFPEITEKQRNSIVNGIEKITGEMNKWTFIQ